MKSVSLISFREGKTGSEKFSYQKASSFMLHLKLQKNNEFLLGF